MVEDGEATSDDIEDPSDEYAGDLVDERYDDEER